MSSDGFNDPAAAVVFTDITEAADIELSLPPPPPSNADLFDISIPATREKENAGAEREAGRAEGRKRAEKGKRREAATAGVQTRGGLNLKTFEEDVSHLKKENLNLKVRIYLMEEHYGLLKRPNQDVFKENIDLKVEIAEMKRDLEEKRTLLRDAYEAMESREQQEEQEQQQEEVEVLRERSNAPRMESLRVSFAEAGLSRNANKENEENWLHEASKDTGSGGEEDESKRIHEELKACISELEERCGRLQAELDAIEKGVVGQDERINRIEGRAAAGKAGGLRRGVEAALAECSAAVDAYTAEVKTAWDAIRGKLEGFATFLQKILAVYEDGDVDISGILSQSGGVFLELNRTLQDSRRMSQSFLGAAEDPNETTGDSPGAEFNLPAFHLPRVDDILALIGAADEDAEEDRTSELEALVTELNENVKQRVKAQEELKEARELLKQKEEAEQATELERQKQQAAFTHLHHKSCPLANIDEEFEDDQSSGEATTTKRTRRRRTLHGGDGTCDCQNRIDEMERLVEELRTLLDAANDKIASEEERKNKVLKAVRTELKKTEKDIKKTKKDPSMRV